MVCNNKGLNGRGLRRCALTLCLGAASASLVADDRNLSVGVGSQALALSYAESESQQLFLGPRVHLSAAHRYFRIVGTVYQTVDQTDATLRVDGFSLDIHTGVNLDSQGWTAYVGVGQFQETWLVDYQPELEAVAYYVSAGGGYHFKRGSLEAEWQMRGNPYGGLDTPPDAYMAASVSLSARF
ncbi:hypothetical protein GCM10007392_22870 [Saccharospirillum salsuginis]|uniref:Outer membrane protein beta-barrel domain-containing protein n=1 Tax=Saccharospirillum salsuginis TaxID=418750 RepID=A0A918K8Q6_9GAMM|nr:hypothetical protein GCM10007392_22870 [Saccharospirillum salsuginis]